MQLLTHAHQPAVRLLGKQSARDVDKKKALSHLGLSVVHVYNHDVVPRCGRAMTVTTSDSGSAMRLPAGWTSSGCGKHSSRMNLYNTCIMNMRARAHFGLCAGAKLTSCCAWSPDRSMLAIMMWRFALWISSAPMQWMMLMSTQRRYCTETGCIFETNVIASVACIMSPLAGTNLPLYISGRGN
jgi:hypothetical protein